ncbi:MAG: methylated-DNA--[protein]-cysteine S-methyltransferase [Verrucomicrobiota bacterium]
MTIDLASFESPVGRLWFAVGADGLCAMEFADAGDAMRARVQEWFPDARIAAGRGAAGVAARLRAYFGGSLHALDDIPVASVGTVFQKRVWSALRGIRVGEIASYRAIAKVIQNPAAVRAVGAANKRNPVTLVVPCHRVIASDGTLCGYAGGLWRKQWLLRHEKALLA